MKWFCALITVAIIPHILHSFFSFAHLHAFSLSHLPLTCTVLIAIIYATFDTGDQPNKVGSTSISGSSSVPGLRTSASPSNNEPYLDPTLQYLGPDWSNERTVSKITLGQTPFARCDVHSVRSEDGKSVINDWIFMEERDAVNVAVQTADGKFAVFRQHKYAIPGETLSPVGGFIDDGETPFEAARREVLEELGLGSAKTRERLESGEEFIGKKRPGGNVMVDSNGLAGGAVEAGEEADWVFLGSYRTMANRGGGFIYTYLLKNAVPLKEGAGTASFQGEGDDESQKIFFMGEDETSRAVAEGAFKEVKWAATMSLSLLHLQTARLAAVGKPVAPVP